MADSADTPARAAPLPVTGRGIIVVGLGPGNWEDLTLQAQQILMTTPRVLCRTLRHPTVDALQTHRPELVIESFDALYDQAASFETLYPAMVERLLQRAASTADEPLVYAVPGHPLLGEESVRRLLAAAPACGIGVRTVAGLSFVEPVCAALALDPLANDLQVVDATVLAQIPAEALMGALLPTRPAMVAQMYNRHLASAVKLALLELFPAEWEVSLVRWAGMPEQEVLRVPLLALDRAEHADHLTTLYIPPLDAVQAVRVPEGLRAVVARLRAPDGCPWDREQTHRSLRRYVLEEAYEVADVLDGWDGSQEQAEQLAEELGDLLLQVYLQAEIGDEEDLFSLGDAFASITTKLIRRHPHVFGAVVVRDAAHVVRNWEAIKRQERAERGEDIAAESVLQGVPRSAPALYQAYKLGRAAAKLGFDWPDTSGILQTIAAETRELSAATTQDTARSKAELGDLLFVLARLADRLGLQPEDALHAANQRFRARFQAMETRAQRAGRDMHRLTAEEWLAWWAEAKGETASGATQPASSQPDAPATPPR